MRKFELKFVNSNTFETVLPEVANLAVIDEVTDETPKYGVAEYLLLSAGKRVITVAQVAVLFNLYVQAANTAELDEIAEYRIVCIKLLRCYGMSHKEAKSLYESPKGAPLRNAFGSFIEQDSCDALVKDLGMPTDPRTCGLVLKTLGVEVGKEKACAWIKETLPFLRELPEYKQWLLSEESWSCLSSDARFIGSVELYDAAVKLLGVS